MNNVTPEVIAEMIKDIQKNEYHGELTIVFNAGNVTLIKDAFTHKPEAIVGAYGPAASIRRKTVFVVSRPKKPEPEKAEKTEEKTAD
jgi:hypothetical protein